MIYFKALRDAQRWEYPLNFYDTERDVLVKNEIFTEREYKKFNLCKYPEFFEKVTVSKKSTYFVFGARFSLEIEGD